MRDIPGAIRDSFGVANTEEVTFTQITAEAYAYRDAVRFKNGREILLQELKEGQRIKVLQLSFTSEPARLIPEEEEVFALRMRRIDFIAPRQFR